MDETQGGTEMDGPALHRSSITSAFWKTLEATELVMCFIQRLQKYSHVKPLKVWGRCVRVCTSIRGQNVAPLANQTFASHPGPRRGGGRIVLGLTVSLSAQGQFHKN